jgi:hypothetical protein
VVHDEPRHAQSSRLRLQPRQLERHLELRGSIAIVEKRERDARAIIETKLDLVPRPALPLVLRHAGRSGQHRQQEERTPIAAHTYAGVAPLIQSRG